MKYLIPYTIALLIGFTIYCMAIFVKNTWAIEHREYSTKLYLEARRYNDNCKDVALQTEHINKDHMFISYKGEY